VTESPSKSPETLQNNVAEARKNCHSMSKIDGNQPKSQQKISAENGVFAEKAPEHGYQMTKDTLSSGKTDFSSSQNGVSRTSKEPCYRRINVYTKSLTRCKKERERRRQVRLLVENGLRQKQIAEKLGVSLRTVKRDWQKIKRYVAGNRNRSCREISEARRKELFPNLSPNLGGTANLHELQARMRPLFQQIRLIGPALKEELKYERRIQELTRKYNRQIIFTIDLDNCDCEGIPSITVFPRHMPVYFREKEFEINFRMVKNGVKHELGGMRFSLEFAE
jgi:hypothetical protein